MNISRLTLRPLALFVALTFLGAAPRIAAATTIAVNATADDYGSGPNGNCTLREAVLSANFNSAFDACPAGQPSPAIDTIQVPTGTYTLVIPGVYENQGYTGDLDLIDDVVVNGAAATATIVDAGGVDRIFEIWPTSTVEIRDMTVRHGNPLVNNGGAVYVNTSGKVLLERMTIRDNISSLNGMGAIYQHIGGFVQVRDSTIRDNQAAGFPAIYALGQGQLANSTVSGNTSLPGFLPVTIGAAVGVELSSGRWSIVHSTFSDNVATLGYDFDVFAWSQGGITIANTLVDGACGVDSSGAFITSIGGNLESPGSTCPFTQPYDQLAVANPQIGALASNFWLTDTHMISSTSPALDAANPVNCLATDQRAVTRPQQAACDIGAVERRPGCIAMVTRGPGGRLDVDLLGVLAPLLPLAFARARRRRIRTLTRSRGAAVFAP